MIPTTVPVKVILQLERKHYRTKINPEKYLIGLAKMQRAQVLGILVNGKNILKELVPSFYFRWVTNLEKVLVKSYKEEANL